MLSLTYIFVVAFLKKYLFNEFFQINVNLFSIIKVKFQCNWLCNKQFHWSIAFTGQSKFYILPCLKLRQNIDLK
jgi:hypothetical protein